MAFLAELAVHGDQVAVWPQDERGFLPLADLLGTPQPDTLVYCCGPEPLLNAVEQACAGWPAGSLHVERFVAKPLTEPVLAEPFEVHLKRSDLTLTVPVIHMPAPARFSTHSSRVRGIIVRSVMCHLLTVRNSVSLPVRHKEA